MARASAESADTTLAAEAHIRLRNLIALTQQAADTTNWHPRYLYTLARLTYELDDPLEALKLYMQAAHDWRFGEEDLQDIQIEWWARNQLFLIRTALAIGQGTTAHHESDVLRKEHKLFWRVHCRRLVATGGLAWFGGRDWRW